MRRATSICRGRDELRWYTWRSSTFYEHADPWNDDDATSQLWRIFLCFPISNVEPDSRGDPFHTGSSSIRRTWGEQPCLFRRRYVVQTKKSHIHHHGGKQRKYIYLFVELVTQMAPFHLPSLFETDLDQLDSKDLARLVLQAEEECARLHNLEGGCRINHGKHSSLSVSFEKTHPHKCLEMDLINFPVTTASLKRFVCSGGLFWMRW